MSKQSWIMAASALSLAAALATEQTAEAVPYDPLWSMPASGETAGTPKNRAGQGNIYGTGGPFEAGITCAACHIGSPGNISVDIDFNPPLVSSGNDLLYSPTVTYDVTVTMNNEQLGTAENVNHFAATFEDPSGQLMGTLQSDSGHTQGQPCPNWDDPMPNQTPSYNTTMLTGDCHGIVSTHQDSMGGEPDRTAWTFSWTAPGNGGGQVTMWWGATDGDSGGKSSLDDDTLQGSIVMQEE